MDIWLDSIRTKTRASQGAGHGLKPHPVHAIGGCKCGLANMGLVGVKNALDRGELLHWSGNSFIWDSRGRVWKTRILVKAFAPSLFLPPASAPTISETTSLDVVVLCSDLCSQD